MFRDLHKVKRIEIKSTVLKSIGRLAFTGTSSNLESIVIPDGVKIIGYGAFDPTYNVNNIYIPKTVMSIDDSFSVYNINRFKTKIHVYKNSYADNYFRSKGVKSENLHL